MGTEGAASRGLGGFVPGLLLATLVAAAAIGLAEVPWVRDGLRWSPLLLVLVLGIAWRAFLPIPASAEAGTRVAQKAVLRWGVAGLGLRLSLRDLAEIGAPALLVVLVATTAALVFAAALARRLAVPRELGLLVGVGGAICGASAIVAADSVVQGRRRDAAVAVGIVTLLGTVGILLYPLVQRAAGLDPFVYAVWDGASLHEMAQVVAAGFAVSEEAARAATVVKLARICLLAPVVLALGWSLRRRHEHAGRARVSPVPWFLVLFVAFAALRSTGAVPASALDVARVVDLWLLCIGMAGVGLETRFADIREAGARPLLLGAAQWVFLASLSFGLASWLCR
jgi:uncharacterized integral membrane protein (TIGR00698 family)